MALTCSKVAPLISGQASESSESDDICSQRIHLLMSGHMQQTVICIILKADRQATSWYRHGWVILAKVFLVDVARGQCHVCRLSLSALGTNRGKDSLRRKCSCVRV